MTRPLEANIQRVVSILDDKKATEISIFDLKYTLFFDHVILCTVQNPIQIKAVVNSLDLAVKETPDLVPETRQSGGADSGWVIIELPGILAVHVTLASIREFYDLDGHFARRSSEHTLI